METPQQQPQPKPVTQDKINQQDYTNLCALSFARTPLANKVVTPTSNPPMFRDLVLAHAWGIHEGLRLAGKDVEQINVQECMAGITDQIRQAVAA